MLSRALSSLVRHPSEPKAGRLGRLDRFAGDCAQLPLVGKGVGDSSFVDRSDFAKQDQGIAAKAGEREAELEAGRTPSYTRRQQKQLPARGREPADNLVRYPLTLEGQRRQDTGLVKATLLPQTSNGVFNL
jgi:hypothetical protein